MLASSDYTRSKRSSQFNYSIGTGRLGLALQEEYMNHLREVQARIGFQYIRGHGLFHDDIGIYQEVETEDRTEVFYNFTYIDRIFDSFLAIGLKPFLELGFMPEKLKSSEETVFYWKGNITPPKTPKKWAQLVEATLVHFIERYGFDEVVTWPIEVWNEPNLTNFWKDADQAAYFELYKLTAMTVKAIDARLQVGGPAICGGSDHWVDDFLTFCKKENVPVDFFSRHAYTSKPPVKTADYYYQELEPPKDMLDQFTSVRKQIDAQGFKHLPFYITEFNTSYSPINPVHDTLVNASYLASILVNASDSVDGFSYWTFSDVFEEAGIPKSLFHGGFGMLALHGIKKPTYHLYEFFSQLGDSELYRDDSLYLTERKDGTLVALAWNYSDEKGDVDERLIEFALANQSKAVFVQKERLTESDGNPWRTWQQLGRPRFPSQDQIERIKKTMMPKVETMQLAPGSVSVTHKLAKNEVCLITCLPVDDETSSYPDLDDSKITSY